MKHIFTHLPRMQECKSDPFRWLKKIILPPLYWLLAHAYSVPGLFIHRYVFQLALRLKLQGRLGGVFYDRILFFPMDSVRYFEFDFMWKAITRKPLGRYLDLSSPRLMPALLLERLPETTAVLVNPDGKDLDITRRLMEDLGFSKRCTFYQVLVDDLDFPDATFDTITSISVVEHIPGDGDLQAVEKLWRLLKPGGRLFLTVPCASEATEEFIDFNEYGILESDENDFVFGQRFYDEKLLQEKIFSVTGPPVRSAVYGEKRFGLFIENREQKVSNPAYSHWREPYMMGKDYGFYKSIKDLPAWGVVAMEFHKNVSPIDQEKGYECA